MPRSCSLAGRAYSNATHLACQYALDRISGNKLFHAESNLRLNELTERAVTEEVGSRREKDTFLRTLKEAKQETRIET